MRRFISPKKQHGFTLTELLVTIIGLAWIGAVIFGIIVIIHFISKFW